MEKIKKVEGDIYLNFHSMKYVLKFADENNFSINAENLEPHRKTFGEAKPDELHKHTDNNDNKENDFYEPYVVEINEPAIKDKANLQDILAFECV